MVDIKARACFNCHVYMTLNAGSLKSQIGMDKFDKDHSHHMVQTIAYNEIGKGYRSLTKDYIDAR